MSLGSQNPLFDNRQGCPALAHEGPWKALNILGRVNRHPYDSDAPQSESVQKIVTLIQENDELKADVTKYRQVLMDIAVPIGDGCGCGMPMCHCFSPESIRIELDERIGFAQETLKQMVHP